MTDKWLVESLKLGVIQPEDSYEVRRNSKGTIDDVPRKARESIASSLVKK